MGIGTASVGEKRHSTRSCLEYLEDCEQQEQALRDFESPNADADDISNISVTNVTNLPSADTDTKANRPHLISSHAEYPVLRSFTLLIAEIAQGYAILHYCC